MGIWQASYRAWSRENSMLGLAVIIKYSIFYSNSKQWQETLQKNDSLEKLQTKGVTVYSKRLEENKHWFIHSTYF